jgi:hypothetical protein
MPWKLLKYEDLYNISCLGYKHKGHIFEAYAKAEKICLVVCDFYWFSKRNAYSPYMLTKKMLITSFHCIAFYPIS